MKCVPARVEGKRIILNELAVKRFILNKLHGDSGACCRKLDLSIGNEMGCGQTSENKEVSE
jgi:hypothetical protein